MKELKPKIIHINAKRKRAACHQTSQHHVPRFERERQSRTTAIAALQPQMKQEVLQQKQREGWQCLTAQAERINQLATELEAAMFEFKAIANDVNLERRMIRASKSPIKSVCEYLTTLVPCVTSKKGGAFMLTTRKVDLFQAEREAVQVARELRRQARRRVASPLKRQLPVLGWLI